MNAYQVNGTGKLLTTPLALPEEEPVRTETQEETEEFLKTTTVRVKVTKVMPTAYEINLFGGKSSVSAPTTIGRAAIGVVSKNYGEPINLKLGQRVILNPYMEKKTDSAETKYWIRGVDKDGFFADFVDVPYEKLILCPPELGEEEAIFTDKVAVAVACLQHFSYDDGEYVVILGADAVGCIMAQLAMYFHRIPIVIDNDFGLLERAKEKGIYYTIDYSKEIPIDRVQEITGGKMANLTVLNTNTHGLDAFLFSLAGMNGKCVVLCGDKSVKNSMADISLIGKKSLQVVGIDNGAQEFLSAINLLVQDAVNLKGFIEREIDVKDAESLLKEMTENERAYYTVVIDL